MVRRDDGPITAAERQALVGGGVKDYLVDEETNRCYVTENRYPRGHKYVKPIELLVLHYTAVSKEAALAAMLYSRKTVCPKCGGESGICPKCGGLMIRDGTSRSAHFLISREGLVYQLASIRDRCWHAGGQSSRWRGKVVNGRSLGIELENYGPLKLKKKQLHTWFGKRVDAPTPVENHSGKWWEGYPEAQVDACCDLVAELIRRFPILAEDTDRIVGHEDVDPSRKIDPGPVWPWSRIRALQSRGSE